MHLSSKDLVRWPRRGTLSLHYCWDQISVTKFLLTTLAADQAGRQRQVRGLRDRPDDRDRKVPAIQHLIQAGRGRTGSFFCRFLVTIASSNITIWKTSETNRILPERPYGHLWKSGSTLVSRQYGNQDEHGNWNGMIKEVMIGVENGGADFAIADLSITTSRASAVTFSMPWMNLGKNWLISKLFFPYETLPPGNVIRTHNLLTCIFLPGISFLTGSCISPNNRFVLIGIQGGLVEDTKTSTVVTPNITNSLFIHKFLDT